MQTDCYTKENSVETIETVLWLFCDFKMKEADIFATNSDFPILLPLHPNGVMIIKT